MLDAGSAHSPGTRHVGKRLSCLTYPAPTVEGREAVPERGSQPLKSVDRQFTEWDNPTMGTAKVDSKKRIVLPNGRPGDIFDIQEQEDGRFLLIRLEKPERAERMTRSSCLEAMGNAPLRLTMGWEEMRKLTREP